MIRELFDGSPLAWYVACCAFGSGKDWRLFASGKRIAEWVGRHPTSGTRALRRLEGLGLLRRVGRKGRRTVEYEIVRERDDCAQHATEGVREAVENGGDAHF